MRNDQHAAGITAQKLLQPLRHGNIQMVCRFVQKQKVRLPQKRPSQQYTGFLPARKSSRFPPKIFFCKAQAKSHFTNRCIYLITAAALKMLRRPGIGRHFPFQFFRLFFVSQFFFQTPHFFAASQHIFIRLAQFFIQRNRSKIALLFYMAHGFARRPGNLPLVMLLGS